jgi:outer membrane protein insertion porin family
MKAKLMILDSVNIFIFAMLIFLFSSFVLNADVEKVKVLGNDRVSEKTIKVISGFYEDFTISSNSINKAIKKLSKSGLFSEVKIDLEREYLLITVVENFLISDVFFEGNKIVDKENLINLVKSKSNNAYSKETVLADVNNMVSYYKSVGRFNAVVKPQLIYNEDKSTKLIFVIDEGNLLEVEEIIFVGNQVFSDKNLLEVIPSNKKGLFSFITDSDNFSESMIVKDQIALKNFYKSNGFIDVRITSSVGVLSADKSTVNLSYKIFEGPQYLIGKVNVDVNSFGQDTERYKSYFTIGRGDVYDKEQVTKLVKKIENQVISSGLPLAKIRLVIKKVVGFETVNLSLFLENNQKLFVERIEIRGNNQTLDRVIRREFDIVEGDTFNPLMLRKTEEELRATGFFEKVDISVLPGESVEKAIVIVDVSEAPTGSLNFGVGYSTDTSLTGSLSLTERNLLGKGQKLNLNLSAAKNSQTLNFGFTEPAFLNRNVSAGININVKKADPSESTYTSNSISLSPSLGFRVGPNSKMSVSYKIESLEINSKNSNSFVLRGDDGSYVDSSISTTLIYDQRNSIIEPTEGYIVRVSSALSGLGGNTGLLKSSIRSKLYQGLINDKVILSAELEGGSLDSFNGFSRVTDRFKLGGRNFRGFQFGEMGPRDISGDAIGGEKYMMGRLEANFPLGLPEELGLYGGVFSEVGSLWSLETDREVGQSVLYSDRVFRSSAGVSLYWSTPIGPLQFNWSKPIDYIEGVDVTETFSLNLATRF